MTTYVHTLTEIETACGVTLDAVADLLPKGLFFDNGSAFTLPSNVSPALALSTARAAFAGSRVAYAGMSALGLSVYRTVSA